MVLLFLPRLRINYAGRLSVVLILSGAFWKAVADDSALSKQFSEADINQMKAGRAPTADF